MTRPIIVIALVAVIIGSGAFIARLPAQQAAPMQTELLAEVRLLRQAIESLAGTNARVQIVFGRLQMQEQRAENAARRLDQVRAKLIEFSSNLEHMAEEIKSMEAAAADNRRKPEEVESFQANVRGLRRELERSEATRARLMADEQEAAALLNQEQGRWADLNRQLDELERALVKQQ
jgi:predicted RNase H-like nuclease (RuvC/YqgF family)